MRTNQKSGRSARRLLTVLAVGILPAFIMRCDKAALNFQRGFFEGLGFNVSAALIEAGLLQPANP